MTCLHNLLKKLPFLHQRILNNELRRKFHGRRKKHHVKGRQSHLPGFGDNRCNETEYYFENGLRKVYPYYFKYEINCCKHWIGQHLLNVLVNEFGAYTKEQYEKLIELGTLTVNDKFVTCNYVLKKNDIFTNLMHKHETPVLGVPLKIIHQSDNLIVLDKPSSLPVSPCGHYRHNSVKFILDRENNLKNTYSIHRLDRMTSGLLMLGLNSKTAAKLIRQIKEKQIQKEYLCRVEGNFPEKVICKKAIKVLSHQVGVSAVDSNGKECTTELRKVSYNGKSSIVLCTPLTGRTHQIRVHLQYLGYPILNDPLYNTELFGPNKGKGGDYGKSKDDLVKAITDNHRRDKWLIENSKLAFSSVPPSLPNGFAEHTAEKNSVDWNVNTHSNCQSSESKPLTDLSSSLISQYIDSKEFCKFMEKYQFDPKKLVKDPLCIFCNQNLRDPKPHELVMFLHAFRYSGKSWSYETKVPNWARKDWMHC